ncbi:MAG: molybdopterin-dependent oxidoreductase [Deltaproteobacteria bacterium]|nr:molybdopterin-dependent oxidoreductase [Deltaproteobacteria bacterium]MBW2444838.1 molybdopterin-dependent oxidoreductase [Deltaproteobacteria bacterium]
MADRTEVQTFCRVCEPACGLVAMVEAGELRALAPDRAHPVTRGFACNKGIAGVEIHHDPDRLDRPLVRTADGLVERNWDEATGEIAERLRGIIDAHGTNAVASYIGNPTAFNTLAGPAAGGFLAQLGVRRTFGSGTQDCANKFAGSEAVFGSSTMHPIPDLEHTDCLLVLGANPRVSHWSFISVADPMEALRRAKARGASIHFVNPRQIESAAESTGDVILIRPDTDVYLLAAMLCEIDATVGFDAEATGEHGKHVAELRDFVRRYPPERAAAVTGIPADRICALAREFAEAPSASVHMSTGVNMGRQGTLAYWLVHMLAFVTGNLDRRGGNLLSVGFYESAKAGRRSFEDSFFDSEFGRLRKGALPGNLMPHYLLDAEEPVRALFVVAGNPVLSVGGEARMREALKNLELLVSIDLYPNATAEYADYLLPATDAFERADINITGLGLQHEPWVQYSPAVVPPRAERREEWWIFAKLSKALGLRSVLDADAPEEVVWGRIDHMLKTRGTSLEALRADPHGVRFEDGMETGRFYSDHLQTADGKVDCCPDAFGEALGRCEAIFCEVEAEGLDRLKLITRRDAYMHNSWYANLPRMKRGTRDRNFVFVHPEDAHAREFDEGAKVRVSNTHGAIELEVKLDPGLRPGVVAITHGWGNASTSGMRFAQKTPGANPNILLPIGRESFEPLSSQAFMTGIPVELEPCGG